MEDRRIRKTKRAFHDALVELLRKREMRSISVRELCDLADSHRSTFYYHYSDIYELYEEVEGQLLDEFSSVLATDDSHTYYATYGQVIAHIEEHRDVWEVLLLERGSQGFRDRVSGLLEERYLEIWKYETGREDFSDEFHMVAKASIAAFMTLLVEWLRAGDAWSADRIRPLLERMDGAFDELLDGYV